MDNAHTEQKLFGTAITCHTESTVPYVQYSFFIYCAAMTTTIDYTMLNENWSCYVTVLIIQKPNNFIYH